jgi:RNA polymerase sigma factor (sigma-70 family)
MKGTLHVTALFEEPASREFPMTDRKLLAEFKATGSHAAFSDLVQRHTDMVYATCSRILSDPSAADDASQATFLVLLRRGRSLPDTLVLSSWLFKVAEFAARNALRARARRAQHEREALPMPANDDDSTQWNDLKQHLDSALATLPGVQRDVVVLRYLKGLSRADVARELRCPERTVQTRLARAMDSLREKLKRRGVLASISGLGTAISTHCIQAAPTELSTALAANCLQQGAMSASAATLADATIRGMAVAKLKAAAVTAAVVLSIVAPITYVVATINSAAPAVAPPSASYGPKALPVGLQAPVARGRAFYVAPNGAPSSAGSKDAPWDLASVLAHPDAIKPGDTIWLRGGEYAGPFVSKLKGTSDEPIVVRQYTGEKAVLTGGPGNGIILTVEGEHTWFWGFSITQAGKRESAEPGPWVQDIPTFTAINTDAGHHHKFINLTISDVVGSAFGFWENNTDSEIYGCIAYNNGWQGPDRGHGVGISVQNKVGAKTMSGNIMFNHYNSGVYAYGSSKASLRNMYFEGNVFFNNGVLARNGGGLDLLVGGGSPAENVQIKKNFFYSPTLSCNIGYSDSKNIDCIVTDNVFHGGLRLQRWEKLHFHDNVVSGQNDPLQLTLTEDAVPDNYRWLGNKYFVLPDKYPPFSVLAPGGNAALNFDEWKIRTGVDKDSQFTEKLPIETQVFVRKNTYEPGRANIVVYNWGLKKNATAHIAEVLPAGTHYEVKNVYDLSGRPVAEGISDGTQISIPLIEIKPPRPVGAATAPELMPDPQFHVFVLLPKFK